MPTTHVTPKKQKSEAKEKKIKFKDPAIEALKSMKEAVRNELTKCESGNELETLVQTLIHDVPVQQVKDDILAAFQGYYPGTFEGGQLHLFGSTVMGLAFKDSDLDYYVELPNCEKSKLKKDRIKKIRSILEPSQKFARFESITNPRVPIIKCTHISTLTNCDFNCSNQLGSLNSPIVAHLLQFDPRIHKLAIVIKYWMKVHDCSGINRISNYAIVWMLIFYLQTLPKAIVPSIEEFQRNVPPSMVSHYNYAFDYSMPSKTENQSQWTELLLGFFKFYRDFDYDTQLICPLYGKTFSKEDVEKKKLAEFQRYEQILLAEGEKGMRLIRKKLCIQDPFEIIRKVPGDISIRNFERIVSKIGYAVEIVECELQKGEIKSLLLQIFDVAKFEQYANNNAKVTKKRKRKGDRKAEQNKGEQEKVKADQNESLPISITSVFSKNKQRTKITMRLKPANLTLSDIKANNATGNDNAQIDKHSIQKVWTKEVIAMISHILRDIFCLDLYENDESSNEFVKKFDLIGARNVFFKRKQKTCAMTWNEEVRNSSNRFKQTTNDIPLDVSVKIVAETENFQFVSIELTDELKTKENNFYRTFYTQFVDNVDYFLKIYSAHRNKKSESVTVNGNTTKMKPATKPITTSLNIPTVSEDAQNSKDSFLMKPTELMLSTTRDMLSKSIKNIDRLAVQQFWAETVIEFTVQILGDIFQLELFDMTPNRFQKTFDASGACDVFIGRKQQKSICSNTLNLELQESINRFVCFTKPMVLSVKIATDVNNFDSVSIEFGDRIGTEDDNFYETFYQQFSDNIGYLLEVYFVHRHQMILKSDTLQCKFVRYEQVGVTK